jgi:hypothetical protein
MGKRARGGAKPAGPGARSALGRTVATQTYGMYAQDRVARLADPLLLAEGKSIPAGRRARNT